MKCLSRVLLLVGFLSFIASRIASAQMLYEVVDFGALDEGKAFVLRGLNSAEEIVGGAATIGGGHRAFKRSRTGLLPGIDDFPGTDWSTSLGLNELGASWALERRECHARLLEKTNARL